jgi:ribose transport system permease protein
LKEGDDGMSGTGRLDWRGRFSRLIVDYGMLGVLLLLCIFFSLLTMRDQYPTGTAAADALYDNIASTTSKETGIVIISRESGDDSLFAAALKEKLSVGGYAHVHAISGDPSAIKEELRLYIGATGFPQIIATTQAFAPVVHNVVSQINAAAAATILTPPSHRWPTFLLPDNIRNVANQITVIAIIAIGMTMVIITAGIDLSVGSLIALSAVVAAWLIGQLGGAGASATGMILGSLGGIILCGAVGAFSGLMITRFRIPPFIATLAMMQVAAGVAYIISQGKPIYQIPDGFIWLGRGVDPLLKIPYAVILMIVLYLAAHIVMTRTTTGRYIYAVGGNMEAARLSGIRVRLILFLVYTVCGMLA